MSCPQCFSGHVHSGSPTGKMTTIHGRQTYVADPKDGASPKGIIIIVPDAFGVPFINNQILADHYAAGGDYKVYLPDFMDGAACPVWVIDTMAEAVEFKTWTDLLFKPYYLLATCSSFIPFLIRNRFSVAMPKVTSFFAAVRSNEGADLPIGVAGFCWGGKHAVTLAAGMKADSGKTLVDAAFIAHPSGLEIPKDIEAVTLPLSLAIGTEDFVMNMKEVEKYKAAVESKTFETEVEVYVGAGHGFAVRADPKNEKATEQSVRAEEQALSFFKRSFAKI